MAYKGKHVQVASSIHLIEEIKDFLVNDCGWSLQGPTASLVERQGQDDEHAHMLGWFLHSTGEDGNNDLNLHMIAGSGTDRRIPGVAGTFYLQNAGGVNTTDTTFELPTGGGASFSAGDKFKIGSEIVEVGSVSGDDLINCVRERNGTTAASHSQYDVLVRVTDTRPYIMLYPFADLSNPIASSTSTTTMGTTSTTGSFGGLDSFDADIFKFGSLIRVDGGTEDGKMRWVVTDPGDGSFSYSEFLTAPGLVNADIISAGFFPHVSRKQLSSGSYTQFKAPIPYSYSGDEIRDVWLYGSKDGIFIVVLDGTTYRVSFWGAYFPISSPITTTAQASGGGDISAGATVLQVANTDIFTADGKYRILGQSYLDWSNNYDQSGSTYMGATGSGEWDNLDCDEIAQEYVEILSVDDVGGEITLKQGLNYSYKSGAIIGEDPRPMIGTFESESNLGSLNYILDSTNPNNEGALSCPFHVVDKSAAFSSHPAHRRRDKCAFSDITIANPWEGNGDRDDYNQHECSYNVMFPAEGEMLDNDDSHTDRLYLVPYTVGRFRGAYDDTKYNAWSYSFGTLPFARRIYSTLGGASEDTIRVMWNGAHETFRIFSIPDNGGIWIACGPEIA